MRYFTYSSEVLLSAGMADRVHAGCGDGGHAVHFGEQRDRSVALRPALFVREQPVQRLRRRGPALPLGTVQPPDQGLHSQLGEPPHTTGGLLTFRPAEHRVHRKRVHQWLVQAKYLTRGESRLDKDPIKAEALRSSYMIKLRYALIDQFCERAL